MELPDTHREALKAIAGGPPDTEQIDPEILAELRKWGLVMPGTLELTGTGARLVGIGERGVGMNDGLSDIRRIGSTSRL